MFRVHSYESRKRYRFAVAGLLLLSAAALGISLWELVDFAREQAVVEELIRTLPNDKTEAAEFLAGELRWQFRLTIPVVLNVVVTGIAVALLWRAYRSSQESLRDIKALAGDILSSMDQAVITTDSDGVLTSINRRGLEMLAVSDECVGRPLQQLSNSVALNDFRRQWASKQEKSTSRDFKTSVTGQERVLRAFCQSLTDVNGEDIGFVLQLRDVTNRVLIEDRMLRMERYMGLGSLAAGLHHEIKNPLAALSLHVQLLEEQIDEHGPADEARQMLRVINAEMNRVGGVLESFRDFASIGRLNRAPVDLRELLQRQIELIGPKAAERSVEVDVQIADQIPNEIRADGVRLEQVLLNLLINAIEAMPDGGRLQVSADVDSSKLRVDVRDEGPGVPDDLRNKIFDPYFTTKGKGTGLGLALCDKIIRQHGGTLELQTSPDGTTFRITLPLTESAQQTETKD